MTDFKTNSKTGSEPNNFVLFSTSACHLCEEALVILNDLHEQMLVMANEHGFALLGDKIFTINELDISEDDELIQVYGKRIPVLISSEDKSELPWPFDIQQAYEFIAPRLVF